MKKTISALAVATGLLFSVSITAQPAQSAPDVSAASQAAPAQAVAEAAPAPATVVEAAKFCWPGGGYCRVVHHSTPDPGVDTGLQVKCKVELNFDYDEISTIPEGSHSDAVCHNLYSGPVAIRNPVGHPVKCIVNTVTLWGHIDGSWWNLGGNAPNSGWWCEVV